MISFGNQRWLNQRGAMVAICLSRCK